MKKNVQMYNTVCLVCIWKKKAMQWLNYALGLHWMELGYKLSVREILVHKQYGRFFTFSNVTCVCYRSEVQDWLATFGAKMLYFVSAMLWSLLFFICCCLLFVCMRSCRFWIFLKGIKCIFLRNLSRTVFYININCNYMVYIECIT